jgi:hypothetical protein
MRKLLPMLLVTGCGTNSGPPLTVTTSFTVTDFSGHGPSPLDPLQGQVVDLEIVWPYVGSNHGDGADPAGCLTQAVGFDPSTRTAHGATAALVQSEILDRLPDWDVKLQLCDTTAASTVVVEAVIDELNLTFGCLGVPASAMAKGADGYPLVTSFTATRCSSTILDVVNNRVVGSSDFSMTIATGPAHLP